MYVVTTWKIAILEIKQTTMKPEFFLLISVMFS